MKLRFPRFLLSLLALLWLAAPAFAAPKPGHGAKKSNKDEVVTITTAQGVIRLILFDDTPLHKANFLEKAKSGFYNGTSFHRVIENFMIQGGDINSKDSDPTNDGLGRANDPTIPAELDPGHAHVYGAVAAARMGGPRGTPAATRSSTSSKITTAPISSMANTLCSGRLSRGLRSSTKLPNCPKMSATIPPWMLR